MGKRPDNVVKSDARTSRGSWQALDAEEIRTAVLALHCMEPRGRTGYLYSG